MDQPVESTTPAVELTSPPSAVPPPPPPPTQPPDIGGGPSDVASTSGQPSQPSQPSQQTTTGEEKKDDTRKSLISLKSGKDKNGDAEKQGDSKTPEISPKVQTVKEISDARNKLPTNKAIDFQVRVRVIEGRNIAGSNVSPVVKVSVSNQARQTRVKKSTNKPFFDEIFFFNFKTVAAELFDQMMTLEVLNSRKLRFDSLIGTFSSDVGFFYDQKDHSVIRKWLLLTDPEDIMGGVKGYLKVTIMVLGPGDEAPEVPEVANEDDEDDLEENLLQPAGVMLRPAVFCLKVFRAEDIPQMDSALTENLKKVFNIGEKSKALVDPYVLMSFAGKQCKTRYIENNDQPEFNQELFVRFQMPSMCEKLKLQIWDWDKMSPDDVVGTTYLPLSTISGQGDTEGFLPIFGPCFVNFYGSTREFSAVLDELEYLNEGNDEGVAYRGRMLVELETKVSGEMNTGVENLEESDIILVQPYLRRRKYKLFGCFLEATMIACKNIPIQFEVSIGNYGNRLDQSVAPSSSSTPASNAVFDGCFYYFLPWGRNKPCCSVDSHWEDISFRLYSMNILKKMVENLEENISRIKIGIEENLSTGELAALVMGLLEELILDCRKPLPEVNNTIANVNGLDIKLYHTREKEKRTIEEAAIKLRESATDVLEALAEIELFHQRLEALTTEPQNSMPDVIIWMLSGSKRIAYYRVPANEILYSSFDKACGKHCGKVQNIFMKYPGEKQFDIEDHPEIPCQISVILWLGLEKEQEAWTNRSDTEGDFCVFAETYENMARFLGKWTTKGLTRPAWSDAEGTVKLLKENFVLPLGWRWEGDWFVDPELSLSYEPDTGHKSYLDDVFECESRLPGDTWGPAAVYWADIYGNATHGPNEIECPEDWEWTMKWTVDCNRAVDENGWEYSVQPDAGSYIPVEKTYHLHRRRRLVRNRRMIQTPLPRDDEEEISDLLEEGGWEYATAFNLQFRSKERKADMVRRRRWHRRMIQEDPTAPAVFRRTGIDATSEQEGGKKKGKEKADSADVPRMMIVFDSPHKYQLRVYLFQARDLLPADADGLSDPYARVIFLNNSQVTHTIHRTLCPTWDQTLVFEDVFIYGSTELLELKPPEVVIELFDKDQVGKDDYLGRCVAEPTVKLNGQSPPAPRLLWYPVKKGKDEGGEILAAFELFLDEGADLPYLPPINEGRYIVPSGIRPVLQRTAIEVLCWGVRNMKKYQLAHVTSPSVEFECGGHVIQSDAIKNTHKNPNFDQPLFFFDVFLPKEELYIPPMNIKVRDNRSFGRHPIVGIHCLKSLKYYRFQTPKDDTISEQESEDTITDAAYEISIKEDIKRGEEATFDWWSKYYSSIGAFDKAEGYLESGNDALIVYPTELERVDHYKRFQDFVETFPLYRGKIKSGDRDDLTNVGEFKGTFRVYPLLSDPESPLPTKMLRNLPSSQPVECVIRVYIIKGTDLQPMDPNGLADPYVNITLGKQKISDQDNYIPNTLNPVIGKMFELTASIPIAKDLTISFYDYDVIGQDELIGETTIDLENRFLSRFRATCGLPRSYYTSGKNQWRDSLKPKQILEKLCEIEGCRPPKYMGNTRLLYKERLLTIEDFEDGMILSPDLGPPDERLALHILNGEPLVPEHIETRSLYSSLQPNIEQGKVQLWVDMFPVELGPPGPPIDVSPRIAVEHELRVIIWNTSDVILDETSITGESMSDIYVKGWVAGIDDPQKTDVHFRSLDGTGNFNWRFVFPFLYVPAEKVMVVRKKRHIWSKDMTESRMPPRIIFQIWDNDIFSPDDFLGQLELVLTNMPKPAKSSKKCSLKQLNVTTEKDKKKRKPVETVSLFDMKRVYGWWPCMVEEDEKCELTGKIEMTLEVFTLNEIKEKPSGKGRSDPNLNPTLDPPNRPATSFLWFASPFKSLRYIIWQRYKWYIIGFIVLVLLLALVVLFFYSMPVRKTFPLLFVPFLASPPFPSEKSFNKNTQTKDTALYPAVFPTPSEVQV